MSDILIQQIIDTEAERDALREELADIGDYNDQLNAYCERMQQRLTAAEQRNAELLQLLRMVYLDQGTTDDKCQRIEDLISEPTESGANT